MSQTHALLQRERGPLALLVLPLLAALFMLVMLASPLMSTSAKAYTGNSYAQGYAAGKKVGRQHGYTDAFKNAYKKSYVDELLRGGRAYSPSTKASIANQQYIRGYKDGYRDGYEQGWRSGRRDGSKAGREDAREWKEDLRDKMRECMKRGGYGC